MLGFSTWEALQLVAYFRLDSQDSILIVGAFNLMFGGLIRWCEHSLPGRASFGVPLACGGHPLSLYC